MLRRGSSTISLLFALAVVCCLSSAAVAGSVPLLLTNGNIGITVDENCNGTINGFGTSALPCGFAADAGPGGLATAMTYDLLNPPGLVVGDVLMSDPGCGGCLSDVVRFNPDGTLVFYSDNTDGANAGADTGLPTAFYPINVSIPEVGDVGQVQYAIYIPGAGMPGYVAGAFAPIEYTFISDTPEPGTLVMFGSGVLGLVGLLRRKINL
jgi:hypothetical protein